MLNLGWVDFSKSDRDIALSVLRLLSEQGAVDELGIGTIRDSFSDLLFPGTSTIQTRAKYLFLLPYICIGLERKLKLTPRNFLDMLYAEEIKLIRPLVERSGRGAGVIGEDAGERLQRKPSSVYWNALRTYGIFTEKVTLSNYAEIVCNHRKASEQQTTSGKRTHRNEDDTVDDTDTGMSGVSFWRVPEFEQNWRDDVTMNLTESEASFLCKNITTMPQTKDSLFALVLRENRQDFPEYETFNDIDALIPIMPSDMQRLYSLARDFSRFVYGAQLRYNVIYSGGENAAVNDLWEEYANEMPQVNLNEVFACVRRPRENVMRFLKRFETVRSDEAKLDELIIRREQELKGKSRAKLSQPGRWGEMQNEVNMRRMNFRLDIAKAIVRDIFEGVGCHV